MCAPDWQDNGGGGENVRGQGYRALGEHCAWVCQSLLLILRDAYAVWHPCTCSPQRSVLVRARGGCGKQDIALLVDLVARRALQFTDNRQSS